ncbi:hypothetical protein IMZ48_29875 [Candidatus Bathyarchaeota archaeon]|nr:hypothetical protein [Candidatus Bathyarchaeota archaeon]
MKRHWPKGIESSVCLITSYQRHVRLFSKTVLGPHRLNPSHGWFQAMDPDTYARREPGRDLPFCEKKDCMNYYRRHKPLRNLAWPVTIHHPCTCYPGGPVG